MSNLKIQQNENAKGQTTNAIVSIYTLSVCLICVYHRCLISCLISIVIAADSWMCNLHIRGEKTVKQSKRSRMMFY